MAKTVNSMVGIFTSIKKIKGRFTKESLDARLRFFSSAWRGPSGEARREEPKAAPPKELVPSENPAVGAEERDTCCLRGLAGLCEEVAPSQAAPAPAGAVPQAPASTRRG